MTSMFSWQNSVSLSPASLCTPRPNFPVTQGIAWLPSFVFQSPIIKITSFGGVFLEGLVGLHRTIQLQLLQHYWLGHRLGLPWYWMVCLGNEQRSFCHFEIASKYSISDSFVDCDGYSISSKGFLSTVVDIMVIWVKFTHPIHFSLLIPKIWMLTLAISCLTTSNMPWFMNLINIPCSYSILLFIALDFTSITSHIHHWVLFLPWLCLFIPSGAISPFFSSSILGTYQPGEFIFQCCIFFSFSCCSWGSQGKNAEVVCHSLSHWTIFHQNSPTWPICLGWPYTACLIVSLS